MATQAEYIIAESKLIEAAEAWTIYQIGIDRELTKTKDVLGGANSIIRFVEWVQKQGEKYKPVLDALIEFLRDMRPLVLSNGNVALPAKWNAVKWLRIGWAAGKLIIRIIKILV